MVFAITHQELRVQSKVKCNACPQRVLDYVGLEQCKRGCVGCAGGRQRGMNSAEILEGPTKEVTSVMELWLEKEGRAFRQQVQQVQTERHPPGKPQMPWQSRGK